MDQTEKGGRDVETSFALKIYHPVIATLFLPSARGEGKPHIVAIMTVGSFLLQGNAIARPIQLGF